MTEDSVRWQSSSVVIASLIAIAIILMLTFLTVIGLAFLAGGSAGGTLSSGRSVMAHSDSLTLSSQFSRDTATIKTAGKVIVVEPARLIVDGKTIAAIPPETLNVEINVRNGVIEFIADGKAFPRIR